MAEKFFGDDTMERSMAIEEQYAQALREIEALRNALDRVWRAAHHGNNPDNGFRRMPPELREAIALGRVAFGTHGLGMDEKGDAAALLRIFQSTLGASRAQCDESGRKLWDRIDAALGVLGAPTRSAMPDGAKPAVPGGQRGHIEVDYGPLNWKGWTLRIGLIVAGIAVLGWLHF